MTLIDVADMTFGEDVTLILYYNIWPVAHAKLVTRVSISGYLCDARKTGYLCVSGYLCGVYGHDSSWKKINFF